jgi:hypothetical protein
MALPNSRNTTYNGEEPILASDLNDLQDQIVNLYSGKRSDRTRVIAPIVGELTNMDFDEPNGRLVSTSAPWSIAMPITVLEGDRIKAITIARFGTAGANSSTLRLMRITAAGTRTQLQTATITNAAQAWVDTTMSLSTPETVASGNSYYIFVDGAQSGYRLNCFRVTDDRP